VILQFKPGGLGALGAEQLAWVAADLKSRSASTPHCGLCPYAATIWDIVAFVRTMPTISPESCLQLSHGQPAGQD
jgi:hypothetical protein